MKMQQSRNLNQSNLAMLLHSIADNTQESIGKACGHDKSWVSRFQNGEGRICIEDLMNFLSATGLRLVSDTSQEITLPKAEYDALVTFSRKALNQFQQSADQ